LDLLYSIRICVSELEQTPHYCPKPGSNLAQKKDIHKMKL